MNIAILSTSAVKGGAAIVTARLADALAAQGHTVTLITAEGRLRLPFYAERLGIFLRNGLNRADLFKVSVADFGARLSKHPAIVSADVVLLGWVNQGLISLREIERIAAMGKRMVWVMHDMWCFTGICHHALGCEAFTGECGLCRFVHRKASAADLSHVGWQRKRRMLERVQQLEFVAVSQWLADLAERSSLLAGRKVHVIPNVFPVDDYDYSQPKEPIVVMGAARLDDPIKGLSYAIEALNRVRVPMRAVFFGDIRQPQLLERLTVPYEHLGTLSPEQVRAVYARAQVVLSTSLYETLPTTLIEGQAAGCVPVSFNRGGQGSIIDNGVNGWLADFADVDAVARGIERGLTEPFAPTALHESVRSRFAASAIASRYLDILR
jgi:glycosyltransferase involved in cell wall biosynthesis